MKLEIYNDNIGYVTDEVSSVSTETANDNEENRIKFATDLAAISRGKSESSNPEKRYKALLQEAALSTPSRPMEFIGVILNGCYMDNTYSVEGIEFNYMDFHNKLSKFSYMDVVTKDYSPSGINYGYSFKLFTNLRAAINAGIPYENIPYTADEDKELYKHFKAIKICVPMFVWSQLMTHTAISKESQSDRVAKNNNYWLPDDIYQKILKCIVEFDNNESDSNDAIELINIAYENIIYCTSGITSDIETNLKAKAAVLDIMLNNWPQVDIQDFLKGLNYPREIWSRAIYYFKYKEMIMTGWNNNPYVWNHLFNERNCNQTVWTNWTQEETRIAVEAIKQIITK